MNLSSRLSFRRRLLPALLLLLPLGLVTACAEPHPEELIDGCAGELVVTVPLAKVPRKVRVEWRAGTQDPPVIMDECSDPPSRLLIERRPQALIVNDGGFGYRPPPTFDLRLIDRGDCLGHEQDVTLIDVTAYPVPGSHGSCGLAELTLTPR